MSGITISREVAEKEVESWLDRMSFRKSKREKKEFKESVENLVDSMMDGLLSICEDGSLKYKLQYPVKDDEGNPVLSELTFGKRITIENFAKQIKISKAETSEEKSVVLISTLTGEPQGLITKTKMGDFTELGGMAAFFLA